MTEAIAVRADTPPVLETPKPAATEPALEEKIRVRAYEIFMERGGDSRDNGDAANDWYRAEAEITGKKVEPAR